MGRAFDTSLSGPSPTLDAQLDDGLARIRVTVPARESTTQAAPPPTAIEAGKPPMPQHAR